jgi:hypothetical protein
MSYEWDVFLSYPRKGNSGDWVRNHFHSELVGALDQELVDQPNVYFDQNQAPGVHWPNHLRRALLRSKVLVAVWSPPYFRSPWCLAEWSSMRAREQHLRLAGNTGHELVYPVVFWDGQNFPREARETMWHDLSEFSLPSPEFSKTTAYVDFQRRIQRVAAEVAARLKAAPPWEAGWPVELPELDVAPAFALPRL